ncbi:MAG TPA: ABC transporter permease, partial [Thauera sp.]|nr:ABC transporter permease [Thauera sp.]
MEQGGDADALRQMLVVGPGQASLQGDWTLSGLARALPRLRSQLAAVPSGTEWNLLAVARLDSFGATLLWRAWGRQWPAALALSPAQR